jgi:two-component system OmpR family response regulator
MFLTARDDRETEASGLTFWGDDYVVKPWSNAALLARMKAILRRSGNDAHRPRFLTVGEVSVDEDAHEVTVSGTPVDLSPTEYKLLTYLMENSNRVLSKAQILDYVWEYDFNGEMGIVESYVSYLRKKLDPLTKQSVVVTKRGIGYMFKSN